MDHIETHNGIQLIRELKQNRLLSRYNDECFNAAVKDINLQYQRVVDAMCDSSIDKQSLTDTAHVTMTVQCMRRNIRCSLAYLNYRLNKIEKFIWESGKNLPDHILEHLSPAELTYVKKYIENLEEYNK